MRVKKKKSIILWLISQERGYEMIKKESGEIVEIKRAIRTLNREIAEKRERLSRLRSDRDKLLIENINLKIIKKEKQKKKLERKLS